MKAQFALLAINETHNVLLPWTDISLIENKSDLDNANKLIKDAIDWLDSQDDWKGCGFHPVISMSGREYMAPSRRSMVSFQDLPELPKYRQPFLTEEDLKEMLACS